MSDLNQQIWTDVLVKRFKATEDALFLNEIPDYSRYVTATTNEYDIINLVDVGGMPEVITNNITYPIGYYTQDDGNIPIQLNTHVTVATRVSIEETQYIAYDKIATVQENHSDAIMNRKHTMGAHALSPTSHSASTPIMEATGDVDQTGRKRLTPGDLVTHKKAYDDQKIPLKYRILVLSSDHYNDLLFWCIQKDKSTSHLASDENGLLKQRLEGFKTFMYMDVPMINSSTLQKTSYGSIPGVNDVNASFSFAANDMFKAKGRTWNITDPINTQTHSTMYNVRHNYVVLPKKQRAIGAIISTT